MSELLAAIADVRTKRTARDELLVVKRTEVAEARRTIAEAEQAVAAANLELEQARAAARQLTRSYPELLAPDDPDLSDE